MGRARKEGSGASRQWDGFRLVGWCEGLGMTVGAEGEGSGAS